MNLREGTRQAILHNAPIAALVGDRVWGGFVPTGAAAATDVWISFMKLFGSEEGAHDGDQKLTHPTYQFTIGGTDKVKVDQVQQLLVKLNCTNYPHEGKVLTFMHRDDRDAWSDGTRVQEPTVDLEVWLEE